MVTFIKGYFIMAAVSKGYSIMPMDKFIKENSKMGSGMAKE